MNTNMHYAMRVIQEDKKNMAWQLIELNKNNYKEEQIKAHKWWLANKERIRSRIIETYNLPKSYKL